MPVIQSKAMNVQVLASDHFKLKKLSLNMGCSIKTLVSRLINDHKELIMLKQSMEKGN